MRLNPSLLMLTALLALAPAARSDDGTAARLAARFRVPVENVTPAPLPGLYQVKLGPQVAYVSADGKYVLHGDIIDTSTGTNLTAEQRAKARLAYLDGIGEQNMIVFGATQPRHILTVLTDIDCQYCRALTEDTPALNAAGVEVRYLPFPRAGVNSPSWGKAVAVWCAKDRKFAYQEAMRGTPVTPGSKCDQSPVTAGYEFARLMGVDGTPILITERGQLISGYMPAPELLRVLDSSSAPPGQGG